MIEQTITVGNIIEIASVLGGGLAVFITLRNTVANLKEDVLGMQTEIKKMSEILIAQADIRGEIKVLENRLATTESDIRELRHGRGFIQGGRGIDGEYKS